MIELLVVGVVLLVLLLVMLLLQLDWFRDKLKEQAARIDCLERTMVLQQKYNDMIDEHITKLENRTRELAR